MDSGVYGIINIVNGKMYIGSSINLASRVTIHKRALRLNNHSNKHLQYAYNKYGESMFVYFNIECCNKSKLLEREQFWIDNLNVVEEGYNVCPIAGSGMLGRKHTQAALKKISEAGKGRVFVESHRQKISVALTGKRNYMCGRNGILNPMYGRNHSDENKYKISLANSGIKNGMHGRIGEKNPMFGRTGVGSPNSKLITFNNVTKNMSEWAVEIGISRNALSYRLKNWALERALTTNKIN
jgi:group I intron endonuclease